MNRENDRNNIELLKRIGESIPRGHENFVAHATPTTRELTTDTGKAFIFGLLNKEPVAVSDVFVLAGTEWDVHFRDEWELMVVYEGRCTVITFDEKGENVVQEEELDSCDNDKRITWLHPGTPHSLKAEEHCSFIAITVPSSPDFPESGVRSKTCQAKVLQEK